MVAPRYQTQPSLPGVRPKMALVSRRFFAWWEGLAFDPILERSAILLEQSRRGNRLATLADQADLVAETIWGHGRLEPGSPAWTMHAARSLMVETNAHVAVLGAGRGAPLSDLGHGTRWRVTGFAERPCRMPRGRRVIAYDRARRRLTRAQMAGALAFFELHRDPEPASVFNLLHEIVEPGGKLAVVDYTIDRRGFRLKGAFEAPWSGAPRTIDEIAKIARDCGFRITGRGGWTPRCFCLWSLRVGPAGRPHGGCSTVSIIIVSAQRF